MYAQSKGAKGQQVRIYIIGMKASKRLAIAAMIVECCIVPRRYRLKFK